MMKFKHLFVVFLAIFAVTALSGCGLNKNTLVASGHPEWAPIMSQSGDKIVGVGPELVEKIFNQLGIKAESNFTGSWDVVQAKARTGEVDVLAAAYKTNERETYMDYSAAYVKDPIAVFVNKENKFSYAKWDDLINKKGVATIGDSYGQEFDDYIASKLNVARVETVKQAFDMLAENQADYFLYALYSGNSEIKKQNFANKIEALPEYASTEDFYITISKKSPYVKYLAQVNEFIEKYKADGTIDALVKKYQEDNTPPIVGGDKDEHGCIGSAGYQWCEVKNKCLRIWEEACYERAEQEIQYLLAKKYNKPVADVTVTVVKKSDDYMAGKVSFTTEGLPNPGEGGMFLAAKQDNVWELVYDGNGSIDCENIKANYKFPAEMLIGFCD